MPVPANERRFYDVIEVGFWDGNVLTPYPSVKVRMDFTSNNIIGSFVYHCHYLGHEDKGMMAVIEILPPLGGCVDLTLLDEHGDGWGDDKLVVTQSGDSSFRQEFSVSCYKSLAQFCPGASGVYNLQVERASSSRHAWEIKWLSVFGSLDERVYQGDVNTKVQVRYDFNGTFGTYSDLKVSSESAHNSICEQCVDLDIPKNPRGPKPVTQFQSDLTLTDSSSNGWFNASGAFGGNVFRISDGDGKRLLSSGTLCPHETSGACDETLMSGTYLLRVGGDDAEATEKIHSWSFCGVTGGMFVELSFEIKDNVCQVLSLRTPLAQCIANKSAGVDFVYATTSKDNNLFAPVSDSYGSVASYVNVVNVAVFLSVLCCIVLVLVMVTRKRPALLKKYHEFEIIHVDEI